MRLLGDLWRGSEAFLRRRVDTALVFENSTANVLRTSRPGPAPAGAGNEPRLPFNGRTFEQHARSERSAGFAGKTHLHGEFDPGSGRTLAARLTHASRARTRLRPGESGERVSNTWVTHPWYRDSPRKLGLIPDGPTALRGGWKR